MTTPTAQAISDPPKPPESHSSWHITDADACTQTLDVDLQSGLSSAEAARRLEQYGPNELTDTGIKNPLAILLEQLTDPMVLILLGAAAVSLVLGETKSVVAIMAIVTLNALLGVSQEWRAERAMAALKKMAAPAVRVRRDGKEQDITPDTLVPGDIVLLEAGSIVPADGRILEEANLSIQEASLTGESVAVEKSTKTLDMPDAPLGDRVNMAYMSTAVTYGRGTVVITDTGMTTELGHIATLIQNVETYKTPLQRRMTELGKALFFVAIAIVVSATIIGGLNMTEAERTLPFLEAFSPIFLAAVAIAVAVVPEGLIAVVTISLALGAQRMLRRRALIRKLPAVETLGSVTTICSDKTGTLTQNQMTVTVVDIAGETEHIDQVEFRRDGKHIYSADYDHKQPKSATHALLMLNAALSNDAALNREALEAGDIQVYGDPTEGALLTIAALYNMQKHVLIGSLPRVAEVPFSSERKRMSTIHRVDSPVQVPLSDGSTVDPVPSGAPHLILTKGAVDGLLDVCDRVLVDGEETPMTPELYQRINNKNDSLAEQGLRVLGLAYRSLDAVPEEVNAEIIEQGLVFTGMVGMIDPPRPEVKQAVAECITAGIRPVMITGDHPLTAYSIARELNIVTDAMANEAGRKLILSGRELQNMSDEELKTKVERVSVYARVSPEHKLRIVEALQGRDHIVAMTGDGVNDAPALKRADIGVAMGITGTDVSKEASEMVILDDNFATIVEAAEEGRTIYDNVRKFIKYILASNTGEVGVLFLTQIFGLPLPLNTLQILWMNLVTDGLPAVALSVEQGEPDTMTRPPHSPKESVFSRGLGWYLVRIGFLIGALGLGVVLLFPQDDPALWGTMIFTTLVFSQMGHAMAIRSERDPLWKIGIFSNKAMIGAVGLTVGLQIVLLYVPFFNDFFGTVPLSLEQFGLALVLSLVTYFGVELDKRLFPPVSKHLHEDISSDKAQSAA